MCGIVGYIGKQSAYPVLIEGLKKLEYRGYDSAGVALHEENGIKVVKAKGEISALEDKIGNVYPNGNIGIGHTRWATHGAPSDVNAHPHCACSEEFAVVHNGIIENYLTLRHWLEDLGHSFSSETDTEVLAHLVEHFYEGDILQAVQHSMRELEGSFATVFLCRREDDRLICVRKDSPLIIGLGEDENFVASDVPAVLNYTRRIFILEDGDIAELTPSSVELYSSNGHKLSREIRNINWSAEEAEKGGYPHFMIKEIEEQPRALRETMRARLSEGDTEVDLSELNFSPHEVEDFKKISIVACGTAYHAGLVGKYIMENILRIPVEVDLASEFRYRDPMLDEKTLVIVISQSGETADTLAALRMAKEKGNRVLAITNVLGSSVAREADKVLYTWAGPEIAVASTKAYLTQLLCLNLLTLYLAKRRRVIDAATLQELCRQILELPGQVEKILEQKDKIEEITRYVAKWEHAFFIGRNIDFAVALEGALKLKEISYIHAEAYASGELKHGTLALIVEGIPVIALATQSSVFEKSMSNIMEVKARSGYVICFTREDKKEIENQVDKTFYLPSTKDILMPLLTVVPLQLLSFYTAVERGCSVDKPRNLAKSVTVE